VNTDSTDSSKRPQWWKPAVFGWRRGTTQEALGAADLGAAASVFSCGICGKPITSDAEASVRLASNAASLSAHRDCLRQQLFRLNW
jgi:hypothetical protein